MQLDPVCPDIFWDFGRVETCDLAETFENEVRKRGNILLPDKSTAKNVSFSTRHNLRKN